MEPQSGDLVAFRPDITPQIARLAAAHLCGPGAPPPPHRIAYDGMVLRAQARTAGALREVFQVGVELMGVQSAEADAEVIALAARCLEAAGLHRFQVDVGHAEFFQGIMDAVKLPDAVKSGVRAALAARDFVALEDLLERTSLRSAEHDLLLRFPALRGGVEILDAAAGLVRNRRSE